MKPSRRLVLGLVAVFGVAAVAFLYFRAKPAPATPEPVAQKRVAPTIVAPSADPVAEPLAAALQTAAAPKPQALVRPPASSSVAGSSLPSAQTLGDPHLRPLGDPQPALNTSEILVPEIAATARMYAAHAPLRTPEIADPDSKSNKQILQTMVLKALAQPASPPPTARQP